MRLVRMLCVAVMLSAHPAAADDVVPPKPDVAAPVETVVPEIKIDPAICSDSAADAKRVIDSCTSIVGNDKTQQRARIAALLSRAKAYVAINDTTRALPDYDAALKLDPSMTDILNARGELRRATGDRPRALADFTAVLKIRPDHEQARENRKSLSREIERLGAEMAVGKKRDGSPLK